MSGFTPEEAAACGQLIALALAEDLGTSGDKTSQAVIPATRTGAAAFAARTDGVLAGLPAVALVCRAVDEKLIVTPRLADGARIGRGDVLATLAGPLRSLLAAERTALNFLQRLSGVATLTRRFVEAIAGCRAQILDTRKTTPGWRLLEKYAVRAGGGMNHRLGLYDGVLIKDNHLAGLGGDIRAAVAAARALPGNERLPIEVEVDSLDQLEAAIAARADLALLDNMTTDQLCRAVARRDELAPEMRLEASGGVNLQTVRAVAATGVDRISVGALTHSAPALDIGLDYLA